ncbi:hypothetical protein HERIO_678 [Hepatospora eriocheir]|uniref:Uncharacterized protein n=1 Tax=Hepatospora eriocheir TaxID=1081669 RepID=A0A1X0QCE7_9MICR|nr:hypothetical protein HERIO_678 [Hepatospora eriocheir]
MKWNIFRSKKDTNMEYVDRTERVFCTRKHCTEACIPKKDEYKIWVDFLSSKECERKLFYENIARLPYNYRTSVYLKCVCNIEAAKEKLKIIFESSDPDSKITSDHLNKEFDNIPNKAIEFDSHILRKIFELTKIYNLSNEEEIFDVFKRMFLMYGINEDILPLIINFIKIPNMNGERLILILSHLVENYGLLEAYDFKYEEVEDHQLLNLKNNRKIKEEINNTKSVFEKIINEEFETFIWLTDLVFATNMTYLNLIEETEKFSKSKDQNELLQVLRSKSNAKFYKIKPHMNSKYTYKKREQNYFDFLVVQNELIKAQERLKIEYETKIAELERKISENK